MNKVVLCGRLVKDPEVRYTQGQNPMAIARYTLAVDRRTRQNNTDGPTADFIGCIAFGKGGEFAEKYLRQGMKILVVGHIQTGSYTNKDGQKVYTTDVIIDEHEFVEKREAAPAQTGAQPTVQSAPKDSDGFMVIPDALDDEGLPFV